MPRHIVIIGGSSGLGAALADRTERTGYTVSTISRRAPKTLIGTHFACDITDPLQTHEAFSAIEEQHGKIDGMVFCQRYRDEGSEWSGEIETGLMATARIIGQQMPRFGDSGSIVLVSSVNAVYVSPEAPLGYHVAKAGLCQLARCYAWRLGAINIRVNAVCPSTFSKPETNEFYKKRPDLTKALAKKSPLNRMCTSDDVVEAIMFLLSKASSFITGQSLFVDGGISLRWQEREV